MKLLVGGKGGAGKSAVSLLLAHELSKKANTILLDSDESNRLLPKTLGLETPDTIANYLGGRSNVRKSIESHEKINLNELPSEYVSKTDYGITYAAVGKIEELCSSWQDRGIRRRLRMPIRVPIKGASEKNRASPGRIPDSRCRGRHRTPR